MLVGSTPTRVTVVDTVVRTDPGVIDRIFVNVVGSANPLNIYDNLNARQVETATVVGTITGDGDATFTVTAAGSTALTSGKAIAVAVLNTDTASEVAAKAIAVLAADDDVAAFFTVSGSGADVVLTAIARAANDATMNLAFTNGTCTGLTPDATSTDTLPGGKQQVTELRYTQAQATLAIGEVIVLECAMEGGIIVDVPTDGIYIIQHGTSYR